MSAIFQLSLLFSAFLLSSSQDLPDCSQPVHLGTIPCKEKPSIRFHIDRDTLLCMAFEYTGCGGNTNNFVREGDCYNTCLPMDSIGCPANSKRLLDSKICREDTECGSNGYCRWLQGYGICCDKTVRDKLDSDYSPKCPKGKSILKFKEGGIETALIGKTCKSKFCPAGAVCVNGNYFATCCV